MIKIYCQPNSRYWFGRVQEEMEKLGCKKVGQIGNQVMIGIIDKKRMNDVYEHLVEEFGKYDIIKIEWVNYK